MSNDQRTIMITNSRHNFELATDNNGTVVP